MEQNASGGERRTIDMREMMILKYKYFMVIVLTIILTITACSPQNADQENSPQAEEPPGQYALLLNALRCSGAELEELGSVDQPFLPVSGQLLEVNDQAVQVFAFDEVQTLQSIAEQISEDGSMFGKTEISWDATPNIWVKDLLLVIYPGSDQKTIDSLNRALGSPITEHAEIGEPYPPYAVIAAEEELSKALDKPIDEINYLSFERREWPNACLRFAREGEICAQVITPGWLIILEADGKKFEFHSDQNGDNIRWEDPAMAGDASLIKAKDVAS